MGMGRTSLGNDGLRRFKLSWGTTESVVSYWRYDFRQRALVQGEDKAEGWHNGVFRLMPGPVARLAGALMYRHLA